MTCQDQSAKPAGEVCKKADAVGRHRQAPSCTSVVLGTITMYLMTMKIKRKTITYAGAKIQMPFRHAKIQR